MKRILTFTALVAVAVLAVASVSWASTTKSVSVKDNSYSKSSITIHKGDSIKFSWKNTGNKHNVTVDSGPTDFHSKTKRGSYSYTHKFGTKGTYKLFCTIHPSDMHVTVKVKS